MTDVEQNVAMLQETYRLYATQGIQPVLDRVTDDVGWCSVGPGDLPWCGTYAGRDGVASFYERLNAAVSIQKASGRVEAFEKADVFRIRDGRIAEFREYYDSAKALEALRTPPGAEGAGAGAA